MTGHRVAFDDRRILCKTATYSEIPLYGIPQVPVEIHVPLTTGNSASSAWIT